MSETGVLSDDVLPRPGPIGRSVRLGFGLILAYFFVDVVRNLPNLTDGVELANVMVWVGLVYVFYVIPDVARMSFSLPVSARQARMGVGGVLLLAEIADVFLGGSPNGAALGLTVGLLLALVLGVLGGSFLVAAAAAAPG